MKLTTMYLGVTSAYLEIHSIKNIFTLAKTTYKLNYEDIEAFQYRWSGSSGGGVGRAGTCQKNVLIELKNGSFFSLAPYGFTELGGRGSLQGEQVMNAIRKHKDIRINKSVGYEYRSCYDRYER